MNVKSHKGELPVDVASTTEVAKILSGKQLGWLTILKMKCFQCADSWLEVCLLACVGGSHNRCCSCPLDHKQMLQN